MNKRRIIEGAKTLAIVLLAVSALALIYRSDYFSVFVDRLNRGAETDYAQGEIMGDGAQMGDTMPTGISVLLGESGKYTAVYSGETLEQCYHRFSAVFAEALGSAETAQKILPDEWRMALSCRGVFISYRTLQYSAVLAAGLGTDVSDAISLFSGDLFVLAADGEGDNAKLYFADTENGAYYVSATAVSANTLINAAGEFQPNNGVFAYETDNLSTVFPYTLIPGETPEVKGLKSTNPLGAGLEMSQLYRIFDLNSGALHQYEEADGTKVLVEGGKTLRISRSGEIIFSGEESRGRNISMQEALSKGYAAANALLKSAQSEASLVLRLIEKQNYGYAVEFDYLVDGIIVELPGAAPAARFEIGALGIESAHLHLRSYSFAEELEPLLPAAQACALAAGKKAADIEIVYRENSGEIYAAWVVDKTK